MKWALTILCIVITPWVSNGAERGTSTTNPARAKRVVPAVRQVSEGPQAPPTNGRYWFQDDAGRWYFWSSGEWVSSNRQSSVGNLSSTGLIAQINTRKMIISYPDDEPLDDALGIEWYKNGRGRFSD